MSNSANIPALGNKIVVDIPALNALLRQMIQAELANVTDLPARAKQLVEGSSGWEVQQFNGSAWVTLEDWNINAQKVDGFSASKSATANAVAVRDNNGALPGNLTGNAATATKAAALSDVNPVAMGGTGATTAEQARENLGITSLLDTQNTTISGKAPTSHASSATTYGVASASNYGHAMASATTPKANGTAAVGSETAKFARGDHVHPAQTTVSGNAGSATELATARTIDGVSFNGSAAITHFGTCSTGAGTAAKTVALTGFTLAKGAVVFVQFTVTNTAANPTLNVNSTGAKNIYYRNAAITAGHLAANRVYAFVYDGSQYELIGDINTDTNTKVKNTLATTTKAYITGTTNASTNTGEQVFDTGVYLTTTAGVLHVSKIEAGNGTIWIA